MCTGAGVCKKRGGKSCGGDGECAAGDCINNRCCKPGCKKTDDHGCGAGCDTSGECNFAPTTMSCGGPKCADATTQIPGSHCDGSGTCMDDPTVMCTLCVDPGGICTP